MTTKALILVVSAMLMGAVLGLHGVAEATHDVGGSLINGAVDTFKLSCNNATTKCATVQVCDTLPGTIDDYEVTLAGYAPAVIVGKGDFARAKTSVGGGCSAVIEVCRPTAGPLKALIAVAHSTGGGNVYDLHVECLDKFDNPLPAQTHTVTAVTNE